MNDVKAPINESKKPPFSRRDFLRAGTLAGATAVIGGTALVRRRRAGLTPDPRGEETIRDLPGLPDVPVRENEDVLVRMQRELVKAMAKPVEQRRWIMVIDTRKCVGCDACTIGCIAENKLPPGVVYRPVVKEETGVFPNVKITFTPRPCMQCENPPCVPVCPVNATWKRPDGITIIDYDKCIGCRYCITACPYQARTSDFGESYTAGVAAGAGDAPDRAVDGTAPWEDLPNFEYAKSWNRNDGHKASPQGNARKCHFCLHRVHEGELPACTTTCIGRATYFGDMNDPDSLIVELINQPNAIRLREELGTKPKVYYLV
jgi:Fe-S-cluster-containing dehydrogenase component